MKYLKITSLAIAVMMLASCGNSETKIENNNETKVEHNDLYFANDMENIYQWNYNASVVKSDGHSGKYFSKADKDSPFSFGLNSLVKELTSKKIRKVEAKAWVSVANKDFQGGLVCSIHRGDSSLFWGSAELKYYINEPAKWFQVNGNFEFPEVLQENDHIAIYVWNNKENCDLYVDDFEIQFSE